MSKSVLTFATRAYCRIMGNGGSVTPSSYFEICLYEIGLQLLIAKTLRLRQTERIPNL